MLVSLLLGLVLTNVVFAEEERAEMDECVAMTRAAAKKLLKNREAGIKEISNPKGKFVWKDSYVFVMNKQGMVLANPFSPQFVTGKSVFSETDYNKVKPKKIFLEFVEIAFKHGEGVIDYQWPKPGTKVPSTKFTFILRVEGTDMLVGAGTY